LVNSIIDFSLAHGRINGNFDAMKTTVERAGRLIIPKTIRGEFGMKPGMVVDVHYDKGAMREIIRRLGTSATQFYRLLDQTN
jgi:AbrB family looped-hinge helix DNA binding protein